MITVLESCLSDPFTVYFATQYTWIAYSCIVSGIIVGQVLSAVKIRISARDANLVFGPGGGALIGDGALFSFSNKKRDCI